MKLQTGRSLHGSVTCISGYNNVTLQRERERVYMYQLQRDSRYHESYTVDKFEENQI